MLAKALEQNETPDLTISKERRVKKLREINALITYTERNLDFLLTEKRHLEQNLPKPKRRNLREERIQKLENKYIKR